MGGTRHCANQLILAAPASDLTRFGDDVAVHVLELGVRLFHRELFVAGRLLEHLPARCDVTNGAARRHAFDIGAE
jgi:hypothetical protein